MGLVKEVFDKDKLESRRAHVDRACPLLDQRGQQTDECAPLVFKYREGNLAIATNGNIVNEPKLRRELEMEGSIFQTTSDTEVIAHLIARSPKDFVEVAKDALRVWWAGLLFCS